MNITQLEKEWIECCTKYGFEGRLGRVGESDIYLSIMTGKWSETNSHIRTFYNRFHVAHLHISYGDKMAGLNEVHKPFFEFYSKLMEQDHDNSRQS